MSYIGSPPSTQSFAPGTDTFSGDGTTVAFTLSRNVATVNDILVVVNNVDQQPTAYTVASNILTFTAAPSSGTNNIYVRYLSTNLQTIAPQAGSVGKQGLDVGSSDGTGAAIMPGGTTAQRPSIPLNGMYRMNSTTGSPEWYSSATSEWVNFGDTKYYIDYLVVAGGGGGGGHAAGGGGGAGGYVTGINYSVGSGASYTITIGAGGNGGSTSTTNTATSGANSSLGAIATATAGGYGSGGNPAPAGASGGSGGGGGGFTTTSGSGTSGQGNNGGTGANRLGAGGGGAGAVGANAVTTTNAGAGGAGLNWQSLGTFYAGGGGGGSHLNYPAGAGGNGGGGAGGPYGTTNGTAGTANTGGGGGGAGGRDGLNAQAGGNGGSGIVIIRYAGSVQRATGGTVTITGGYVIHTFTTSGTFTA